MQKWVYDGVLAVVALFATTLLVQFWLPFWQSFRIVFGTVAVLFLPGFMWSKAIWDTKEISGFDRAAYSILLSLILVPFTVFICYRIGIDFSPWLGITVVLGLITTGATAYVIKKHY